MYEVGEVVVWTVGFLLLVAMLFALAQIPLFRDSVGEEDTEM